MSSKVFLRCFPNNCISKGTSLNRKTWLQNRGSESQLAIFQFKPTLGGALNKTKVQKCSKIKRKIGR